MSALDDLGGVRVDRERLGGWWHCARTTFRIDAEAYYREEADAYVALPLAAHAALLARVGALEKALRDLVVFVDEEKSDMTWRTEQEADALQVKARAALAGGGGAA